MSMLQFIRITLLVCCLLIGQITLLFGQTCNPNLPVTTPTSRYTDNGDGTVTDSATGLMWKRCREGQSWNGVTFSCEGVGTKLDWQSALQAADSATFAGQSDWRLPNIKELYSIAEMQCENPAINLRVFPNSGLDLNVWSGSPGGRGFDFSWGNSFIAGSSVGNQIFLVRGGG